jgi:hypothetical protein
MRAYSDEIDESPHSASSSIGVSDNVSRQGWFTRCVIAADD